MGQPADGRYGGANRRFYLTVASAIVTDDLVEKIQAGYGGTAADATKGVRIPDIIGTGKAFTSDLETARVPVLGDDVYELKGVSSVPDFGATVNTVSESYFGGETASIQGSVDLADMTFTISPNLFNAGELLFFKTQQHSGDATAVAAGTQVLCIDRLQGVTTARKTYNVILGTIGPVQLSPQLEGSQRYTRAIAPSAIVLAIPPTA